MAQLLQPFSSGVSHFTKLAEGELVQPPDNTANPWHKLLEGCPDLAEVPFIIPVNTKTSLVTEHSLFSQSVTKIFSSMAVDLPCTVYHVPHIMYHVTNSMPIAAHYKTP